MPLAHGGDDLQAGVEGDDADVESDLVVAFARAAVGDVLGALLLGDLDELLRDEGPADGGAQRIDVLVEGVSLQGGPYVLVDELVADLDEVGLDGAVPQCTGDDVVGGRGLSEVQGDGDHIDIVLLLEPTDGDGGVQSAGVC